MYHIHVTLAILTSGSRQLSVTEFSVPASLEVGQDAHLKCKYDLAENENGAALFVKWWWLPGNGTSGQRVQLYQRIAGYDPVAIGDNVGKYQSKANGIFLNYVTFIIYC